MWVSNACFRVVLKYMYLEFSVLFFQFLSFPIYRVFFFFQSKNTGSLSCWVWLCISECVGTWLSREVCLQLTAPSPPSTERCQEVMAESGFSLLMNKLQWTGLTGTQDFLNKGPLEFLCKQQSDFSPFWYT